MKILGILLFLTYCLAFVLGQETQDVVQKDLEDLVRRLTLQPPMRTTQYLSPSVLDYPRHLRSRQFGGGYGEDPNSSPPDLSGSRFQSNPGRGGGPHAFASSFASVKRPYEGTGGTAQARSEAKAFASVKDVNQEEHLGESRVPELTTVSDMFITSSSQEDSTGDRSTGRTGPYVLKHQQVDTVIRKEDESFSDVYFVAIVAGCCAVGIFGVISAGFCFYKLQKSRKAAADVDYPAYGVTGPCKDVSSPNGDRKLAQSAQMYHYQHQKQQMIAVEKAGSTKNTSASDVDSEEENEEGDYTVYECPGLAPAGEMEVKNPLFHDDSTPVSPPLPPAKSDN